MNRAVATFLILSLSLPAAVASGEPAKAIKNESLREKPFSDAKVVISLKAGQTVDIRKREGSWFLLNVDGKTGWTPMLSIRRASQTAVASAGSLSQTATGRASTGKIVASTGVRGLSEEELREAKFDEGAIGAAERLLVSTADALAFARDGGLSPREVPSLQPTGVKK